MPRKLLVLLAFLPLAIASVAFWHSGRDAVAQTTTTVNVGDFYFCDPSFSGGVCDTNINVGDTVTWQWVVGSSTHIVAECDATFTTCPPAGGFDSGPMASGTFSQTFNTPGTFEYRCNIHTTLMRGRIIVAAQATPTATAGPTASAGATISPAATSAPTSGAGQPASPTPVRSAAPAAVPQTGGPTSDGGTPWTLLLAASAVALVIGSGVLGLYLRRR